MIFSKLARFEALGQLTDSSTAAGFLSSLNVVLFTGDTQPNEDTVYTDLTKATFTGSDAQAVVWQDVYNSQDGASSVTGESLEFICSGGTPNEIITGYALVQQASGHMLVGAERLDVPVAISAVGDGLVVVPELSWANLDFGSSTVIA